MDLAHLPAEAPPPGVTPNFVNPENHAKILIVVSTICLSLLLPFVALRLYSRIWVTRTFGLDDASCVLATVGTLAYTGVILSSLHLIGRHQWDLPIIAFTDRFLQELVLVYEMVYGPAIFFAKSSLFFLYVRLFSPNQWTKLLIYFGLITPFAFYLGTTITFGALCIPRSNESWGGALFSPRCAKSMIMTYVQGIFNVVSDFYILFIPIPVVLKLQLPLQKKIGVCAIFMTGLLACIASTIGLYYRIILARNGDFMRMEVPVGSLVILELSMGIICGCMPYLTSFFRRQNLKFPRIPLLKSLTSRITSIFSGRFGRLKKGSNFNRVNSLSENDHYLETRILRSVQGEGRFLNLRSYTQKDRLDRTVLEQGSQRDGPIPEGWSV